jgi:hypothetical protein
MEGALPLDAETRPSVPAPASIPRIFTSRERFILFYLQLQREKHWYVSQLPPGVPMSESASPNGPEAVSPTPSPCHSEPVLWVRNLLSPRAARQKRETHTLATEGSVCTLASAAFDFLRPWCSPAEPPRTQTARTKRPAPLSLPYISRISNWTAKRNTLSRFIFPCK